MHFSFSRRWGPMDFKVWLSFIAVGVLCLGLLSYKMATTVTCPKITLAVSGKLSHVSESNNTFYINEQLIFAAGLEVGKHKVEWDFGDKTEKGTGIKISHVYAQVGTYLVTAIVDGTCTESINLRITDGLSGMQGPNAPELNPIVSGDVLNVGNENIFNTTLSATSYTWSVEELPQIGKITTPTAKFIFPRAGNFTVNLLLSDGRSFRKMVQVIDPSAHMAGTTPLPPVTGVDPGGPPPPLVQNLPPVKKDDPVAEVKKEEAPAAAPARTYEQLPLPAIQAMLEEVTEGKKDVADFNSQLCNGAGTKVVANDQPTTFAQLCLDLKKKKKKLIFLKKEKSISSVKVTRDENNGNCISVLYVNYK